MLRLGKKRKISFCRPKIRDAVLSKLQSRYCKGCWTLSLAALSLSNLCEMSSSILVEDLICVMCSAIRKTKYNKGKDLLRWNLVPHMLWLQVQSHDPHLLEKGTANFLPPFVFVFFFPNGHYNLIRISPLDHLSWLLTLQHTARQPVQFFFFMQSISIHISYPIN